MLIRGRLERSEGVVNIVAEHLAPLPMPANVTVPRLPVITTMGSDTNRYIYLAGASTMVRCSSPSVG